MAKDMKMRLEDIAKMNIRKKTVIIEMTIG